MQSVEAIAGAASNIRSGDNEGYTSTDFLGVYSQYAAPIVPTMVLDMYIEMANKSIKKNRYRGSWEIVIGLYVAHYCALWVASTPTNKTDVGEVAAAGQVAGITTSESVDGISYTIDVSSMMQDLNGFAAFKSTSYGIQFATFAKIYSKGGMVVI